MLHYLDLFGNDGLPKCMIGIDRASSRCRQQNTDFGTHVMVCLPQPVRMFLLANVEWVHVDVAQYV